MTDRLVIVGLIVALGLALIYLGWVWADRRDLERDMANVLDENEEVLDQWYEATFTDLPPITPEPPAPEHGQSPSGCDHLPRSGAGPSLVPDWRETTFTGRLLAAATGTPEDMDAVFAGRRTA